MKKERLHRPHMPIRVKRRVKRRQKGICACGCGEPLGQDGERIHYDHTPALGLRAYSRPTRTYTPDANDPAYIDALREPCHRTKTNGSGATCADGDLHKIWKSRRLANRHARHAETMAKKWHGKKPKTRKGPKIRMRSRPFATNRGGKYRMPMRGRRAVIRQKETNL